MCRRSIPKGLTSDDVDMDEDVEVNFEEAQAKAYNLDLQYSKKVLNMQDINEEEPDEVEEVLEVVTAAKLITEVVTIAEPTTTAAQIDMDEAFARHLEAELNANINWNDVIEQVKRSERRDNAVMSEIRHIFEKHYNSIQAFLEKVDEEVTIQEEGNKRQCKSLEQEINKKQRMDEEAEELKRHLQIMANDDDDVYTEATPLALKLVKERFETTEPKNFSDDFLLNILKIMFEKPDIEANVWRDQKGRYGLAKVKSWKLFESCGVHIITFTTTQMILLVEKKYPLTHFTLEKMLNNLRLKVEKESEMSLELLRLVRRQLNEGYVPE
uniref:Uncharacterized protein n=1 Tax=Tanacetum cinerariifolium TaxID=118510 RepID=A0A699HGJ6_TANCI|nr:hypothetical protein [Tanacetum cinerariifolium]